jgi:hypothetical protein
MTPLQPMALKIVIVPFWVKSANVAKREEWRHRCCWCETYPLALFVPMTKKDGLFRGKHAFRPDGVPA